MFIRILRTLVVAACLFAVGSAQGHAAGPGGYNRLRGDDFLNQVTDRALRNTPIDVNFVWNRGNGQGNRVVVPGQPGKSHTINLVRGSGNGSDNEIYLPGSRRTTTILRNSINGDRNVVIQGGRRSAGRYPNARQSSNGGHAILLPYRGPESKDLVRQSVNGLPTPYVFPQSGNITRR